METPRDKEKWLRFLDPENLKDNLLFSSLYVAYFESFKEYVVETVKFFFNTGFSEDEYIFSDDYKTKVLSKDKSPIKATLIWLKELEAIDQSDILLYDELRQYRNKLSHELLTLLFEGLHDDLPKNLTKLINVRVKIEKWWILNIEIPTSGDYEAHETPTEEDIMTGSQLVNKLIFDMLSGDEKKANYYREEFAKKFEGNG